MPQGLRAQRQVVIVRRNEAKPWPFHRQAPAALQPAYRRKVDRGNPSMRSILLFMIGVPLPVILLLAMCSHHF